MNRMRKYSPWERVILFGKDSFFTIKQSHRRRLEDAGDIYGSAVKFVKQVLEPLANTSAL